ncbi:MAG: hypothetical protein F4121_12960 [Acidimicrobiia bacterium]|nr:hypothetical protein [Acidimicrobiia bacterium]
MGFAQEPAAESEPATPEPDVQVVEPAPEPEPSSGPETTPEPESDQVDSESDEEPETPFSERLRQATESVVASLQGVATADTEIGVAEDEEARLQAALAAAQERTASERSGRDAVMASVRSSLDDLIQLLTAFRSSL